MTKNAKLTTDANGMQNLILNGEWIDEVENAIEADGWKVLSLFQVEWPDYTPLKKYSERIHWLRVPFGPDKSRGLSDLQNLRVIQLYDSPKPSIDFRSFGFLERLEAPWDKKHPEYLANEHVEELIAQGVGGEDLMWMSAMESLCSLTIKGGKISSLKGLDKLASLRKLKVDDLRYCTDVKAVCHLHALEKLAVDAPAAVLEDINWISSMPNLKELSIDCHIEKINWEVFGVHPVLQRISLVAEEGYASSNEEILKFLSAFGRKTQSFSRSTAKSPVFSIVFS